MTIKDRVEQLCSKFHTRDPFDIAAQLGIIMRFEPLGTVRGYYGRSHRFKVIHINNNLDRHQSRIVCAHELGHAILHPDANTPFLRANTFLSVDRLEVEANRFMVHMLLADEQLRDYADYGYTIPQIAASAGLPTAIIEYRVSMM